MCSCLHAMVPTSVLCFSLTACTLWQCEDNAFWPQSYIQTRMHHHNISGCVLCVRQLWGGQSQDEVSCSYSHLTWNIHNGRSCMYRWELSTNHAVVSYLIKYLPHIIQWWYYVHFREFAKTIKRPFTVRYNPYTQSVDVLKDTPSINSVVEELRHELDIVGDALSRLNKQLGVWLPTYQMKLFTCSPSTLAVSSPSTAVEILLVYRPSSVQWMCTAFGKTLCCPRCMVYGLYNLQRRF